MSDHKSKYIFVSAKYVGSNDISLLPTTTITNCVNYVRGETNVRGFLNDLDRPVRQWTVKRLT